MNATFPTRSADAGIDAILFDLGGVLIELGGVDQLLGWCPDLGSVDEMWRRWLHSPAVRRFERGEGSPEDFAAEMIAEFALDVDPADFLAAFAAWPRALFPGAVDLLAELAPRYRLASVSNTNAFHWARFSGEWGLDACFHANFPSHQVGRLKPDADYFAHVLAELGVAPERTLFVDDNRLNVEAAAAHGIVARRVVGVAGARAVIVELGLLR